MKYNDAKLKFFMLLTTLFIGVGLVGQVNAETFFYRNLSPGAVGSPSYYGFGPSEVADDTPFTGSHLVSSFRFGYRSKVPSYVTFRFYGVDSATGLPGHLIAEVERLLPASDYATPTITLDESEQFIFTAEPNLFSRNVSGGWVSMQFASTDGSNLTSYNLAAQLGAGPPSANGLYSITHDRLITLLDPSGIVPVSFFLEMSSAESTGVAVPKVTGLSLFPSSISVGTSSTVTATLSSQAPTGGVVVKFSTDKKGIYFNRSEVVVKEGRTYAINTIFPTKSGGPKGKNSEITVNIIAEANGGSAEATLTITK